MARSSKGWIRRHVTDAHVKKAREQGYRSRAAFKLLEIDAKDRLLKPGFKVLDLGAAPGGWLQVAANIVGPKGRVIGVDLQPMDAFREPNIIVVQGDITSDETRQKLKDLLAAPAHCVISDLAPKLSGIRDADSARCLELNQTALRVAARFLKPSGNLLMKSFVSNDLHGFTRDLKNSFRVVERTRPEATRRASSEFYFCAKDFCPKNAADP